MDIISWQDIVVRLLFAFILGSATAISKRWYETKQFIQSNTQMALGTSLFAIHLSLTSQAQFSAQLILGISIICVGVSLQKQSYSQNINTSTVTGLWCAGAVGSMVGFGFFVPAYIGILIVILTNLLFQIPEIESIPNLGQELNSNLKPDAASTSEAEPIMSQETCYHCQVNCLATDEAEVLAQLVQLSREHNLTATGIRSRSLAGKIDAPEIEIQVDFISDSNNSTLQLQQILLSLKSKLELSSASWLYLSPESRGKNNEAPSKSESVNAEN